MKRKEAEKKKSKSFFAVPLYGWYFIASTISFPITLLSKICFIQQQLSWLSVLKDIQMVRRFDL